MSNRVSGTNYAQFILGFDYTFVFQTHIMVEYFFNQDGRDCHHKYTFSHWMQLLSGERINLGRGQNLGSFYREGLFGPGYIFKLLTAPDHLVRQQVSRGKFLAKKGVIAYNYSDEDIACGKKLGERHIPLRRICKNSFQ